MSRLSLFALLLCASIAHAQEWKCPAYAASDFSAIGAQWVVEPADVESLCYVVNGSTMTVIYAIKQTSVVGSPQSLQIRVPGGYVPKIQTYNPVWLRDNTVKSIGIAFAFPAFPVIVLQHVDAAVRFQPSDNQTSVVGEITFPIIEQ